jgi:drug/metabolite transporter (DMT)-like permease
LEQSSGHRPACNLETFLGLAAIGIWSSLIAVARVFAEELGPLRSVSWSFSVSAAVGLLLIVGRRGGFRKTLRLPRKYLLGCGSLFVICNLSVCLAVGLADTRRQVVTAGLINYLWPSLTLLLSVPILKARARWSLLAPGVLLAGGGVFFAMAHGAGFSVREIAAGIVQHPLSPLLALVAALSWSFYSNLARRWGAGTDGGGAPLFLLATAPVIWLVRLIAPPEADAEWTSGVVVRLLYIGVLGNGLGYVFWDIAMRRGRMLLVAALSYLIPLFSTVISCVTLGVKMEWSLWTACALVIGGAAIGRKGLTENRAADMQE